MLSAVLMHHKQREDLSCFSKATMVDLLIVLLSTCSYVS